MNGLIYILDQLGSSLAQANDELARLAAENAMLRERLADLAPPPATPE